MSNNRKQKVFALLDSLTQAELDSYIKDKNISLEKDRIMEKLSRIKKPETHYSKLLKKIDDDLRDVLTSYYNLGAAWVVSLVLECFYDDKYKIADIKTYMKSMMQNNKELKEMVYDCMKDM